MDIFKGRSGQKRRCRRRLAGRARLKLKRAFQNVPAEVQPAGDARLVNRNLLPLVLADIADRQVPGRGVEGEAERVAKAEIPDLRGASAPGEGIVRWDRVVRAGSP